MTGIARLREGQAPVQHADRFSAALAEGDVVHLWHKPASNGSGGSRVHIRVDGETVATLTGPPSDDFQMASFTARADAQYEARWDASDTLVSVAYAFAPERVFDDGIHMLFARAETAANTARCRLHLAPPFGWMNDPNGLIETGGRTHLFYQHYPHARHWDTMHWGHATSDNLVDWIHLPVFLHPAPHMLADSSHSGGAYSGSAIARREGGLRIFHTDREDRRAAPEWQMTAVSSNAIEAGGSTPVLSVRPSLPGFGPDLRDPYVFMGPDGLWKMLLGGADETAALVLLYETETADAADGWRYVGVAHREPLARAVPAECPCLVALDGEGEGLCALVFGLIGHRALVNDRFNPSYVLIGRFDGRSFEEVGRRELDFIGDCYAFQGFRHRSGPVGLAWAANWAEVHRGRDFPSAMTFPRRLVWSGGRLSTPPVEAVKLLRRERVAGAPAELVGGVALPDGLAEISLTLKRPGAPFRLDFDHPECRIAIVSDGRDLEFLFEPRAPRAPPALIDAAEVSQVEIFVDVGLIEIFVNGGRWSGVKRVGSDAPIAAVRLHAESDGIVEAEVWSLRPRQGA